MDLAKSRSMKTIARAALLLVAAALAGGCGQARNSPSEALASLKTALEKQRWDLLYDILPDEEQKVWDQRIESILADNSTQRQLAEMLHAQGVDIGKPSDVLKDLKLTPEQWSALSQREKFARMFGLNAKLNLGDLGVNPDFILGATTKPETILGDRAEIVVDDNKGHRTRLTFKLQGDLWRFQLGGEGG